MINYENQITINRPAGVVFDYVTNFENLPRWTDTNAVTRVSQSDVGPGSRFRVDMGKGPFRHQAEYETTNWDQNRRWAFRTTPDAPIGWEGVFSFEPDGVEATRVSSEGRVSMRGWRRLLEPLARIEIRHGEKAELEALKALMEESHPA